MRLALAALAFGLALVATEVLLRVLGFGAPVLYENRLADGYGPVPSQLRARLGGSRVSINALGLRGPEVTPRPAAGTVRLLFLGDSVTYGGSAVGDDDVFAARAAALLRAARPGVTVEALDAGVNGWGPENVRGFARRTGGFASTVWILTLIGDDFLREKTHFGETPYFARAPWLAWEEVLMAGAYRLVAAYKVPKSDADLTALTTRNLRLVRSILAMGRRRGARVLLVWHPTAAASQGSQETWAKRALAAQASADGTPWLDLLPAYRAAPADPSLYADGWHLSAAGHAVAGRAIAERLLTLLE